MRITPLKTPTCGGPYAFITAGVLLRDKASQHLCSTVVFMGSVDAFALQPPGGNQVDGLPPAFSLLDSRRVRRRQGEARLRFGENVAAALHHKLSLS